VACVARSGVVWISASRVGWVILILPVRRSGVAVGVARIGLRGGATRIRSRVRRRFGIFLILQSGSACGGFPGREREESGYGDAVPLIRPRSGTPRIRRRSSFRARKSQVRASQTSVRSILQRGIEMLAVYSTPEAAGGVSQLAPWAGALMGSQIVRMMPWDKGLVFEALVQRICRGDERGGVARATVEDGETPPAFSGESEACEWIWTRSAVVRLRGAAPAARRLTVPVGATPRHTHFPPGPAMMRP